MRTARIAFFVVAFLLCWLAPMLVFAADDGGGMSMKARALSFGLSMVASLVAGKAQKDRPRLGANDMIPAKNATICGGGAVAIPGADPLSAIAGSLAANYTHQFWKWITKG